MDIYFFDLFFHVFFCFSDHHYWPFFFLIKPFCAQTFANHPWPQKTLANGAALRDNLLLMSCFLGHGPPCEGPPVVLCGLSLLCCVLWCGVSVRCVFKIFVGASKIWALSRLPSAGPPPPTPPSPPPSPLRRTAQNFVLFSLSRHCSHSFFLSWGSFRWILVVFEAPGPSNMHVWALGLSCETSAALGEPDSAACCCFSCCLCSCCGLLLPLFLLLLVLVAAFGPPTVEPPLLSPLQCLTFQNVNNNFLQPIETKFSGIRPNSHGETLLPPPPCPPPPFGAPQRDMVASRVSRAIGLANVEYARQAQKATFSSWTAEPKGRESGPPPMPVDVEGDLLAKYLGCHFFWDTTFRVLLILGYKKLFFWIQNFFWDTKNFFGLVDQNPNTSQKLQKSQINMKNKIKKKKRRKRLRKRKTFFWFFFLTFLFEQYFDLIFFLKSFFFSFFWFCCWFFDFSSFFGLGGVRREIFSIFFDFWDFFFLFLVFSFYFLFWVKGRGFFFYICFFHVVFLTTFGPQTASCPFFWSNRFVPKPLRTILDPKKPWPMGLLFGTICCSCLVFWAMDLLARDPLAQDHPVRDPPLCCVVCRCCCVVVCRCGVCSIFVGASKIWTLPRLPLRRNPLPRLPLRRTPLLRTAQNFAFFSLSRPHFRSLSLSLGVFSWNSGGVIEGRDPQMCTFGVLGLSCETPAAFAKCQEQFYNWFAPWESMTNYCKFCLYPEKKLRTQPKFHGTPPPPSRPTPLGPIFLGCCLCCLCCSWFCCLLLLLGRRPSNPLPSHLCSVWPSKMLITIFYNQLRQKLPVSHRISTGKHSSSPPLPPSPPPPFGAPHLLALIVLGFPPNPHSGLLAPVVVWKTHPCRFWPSKMFVLLFFLPFFAAAWCWLFLLCAVVLAVHVASAFAAALGPLFKKPNPPLQLLTKCLYCFSCCCLCNLLLRVRLVLFLLFLLLFYFCLYCCCFVAAAAAGAVKSPTVEKPIFARFGPSKMFLLLILLFVLLCCLCGLLFVLFLLLLLLFFFCLHYFAFSVVCPAFAAAFWVVVRWKTHPCHFWPSKMFALLLLFFLCIFCCCLMLAFLVCCFSCCSCCFCCRFCGFLLFMVLLLLLLLPILLLLS